MREKVGKSRNTVFFPTCQVRVVRFYVSCFLLVLVLLLLVLLLLVLLVLLLLLLLASLLLSSPRLLSSCFLPDLNHDHPRPVFPAGPQPRPSTPSVPCRTSTTIIPAQCSCRTSTTTIHAQCSLPDLNREYPRQVFPAGPHVGRYGTKNVQKKVRKNVRKNVRRYARRYAR